MKDWGKYDDEWTDLAIGPSRVFRIALWSIIGLFVAVLAVLVFFVATARAHEAPTGWSFDPACCGGNDCKPVPTSEITVTAEGYKIATTGEVIPFQSTKVRVSPDGMPYRCSVGGLPTGHTYCIYVSKGGF